MPKTGVFPVFDNKFKIGKDGRASKDDSMVPIAEMTSFSVSIDGNVQEWTPMDAEGWMKRMTTGKALTVSLSGKLCPGDPGNDYIAGLAWKSDIHAGAGSGIKKEAPFSGPRWLYILIPFLFFLISRNSFRKVFNV